MKKFIFLIAIFFMSIIPIYAWDEITVYNAYEQGNLETIIPNCGSPGQFNWNKVGIGTGGMRPWAVGYIGGTGNNLTELSLSFKYDLPAQKYYDLQINFDGTPNSNFVTNKAYWYTGSTCGNQTDTGKISYIGFSKGSNYARFRFYTNSIIANWRLDIYSSNYIIDGNWGITGVYLREVDTTGTNEIITNNTQNSQNIINNQNQNTQNIINNQNQNTQDIINSSKSCNNVDKNNIYYNNMLLDAVGRLQQNNLFGVTDFYKINQDTDIYVKQPNIDGGGRFACFYNSNKSYISCITTQNMSVNEKLTIPSNADYILFTIDKSANKPQYSICKNGNQATTDALTDDSVPTGNDFLDDLNDMLPTDNTISSLITLPLSLYNKVLDSINGTCSSITLGSLYNTNLVMPCIDIESYIGSSLWALIDAIISGGFVIIIAKKMVKAFHSFSELKEGDVINND